MPSAKAAARTSSKVSFDMAASLSLSLPLMSLLLPPNSGAGDGSPLGMAAGAPALAAPPAVLAAKALAACLTAACKLLSGMASILALRKPCSMLVLKSPAVKPWVGLPSPRKSRGFQSVVLAACTRVRSSDKIFASTQDQIARVRQLACDAHDLLLRVFHIGNAQWAFGLHVVTEHAARAL